VICSVASLPNIMAGMSGPLTGRTIIELAGIGPGPFAGMLFADMGATVIRVERAQAVPADMESASKRPNLMISERGRQSIGVDLKLPEGRETIFRLVEKADALFEGFRPGVTERLGLGPDVCLARNPKLVYGRMTGWGQDGPYAMAAGHDINYISLAGALEPIGRAGAKPVPPLNLVGDFGGGGMFLAFGMVCAMLEASVSGKGQVVDAAMVDGSATLMSMFHSFAAMGIQSPDRGTNMLDTGAYFYDVYECSDGKYVSIGSIEPQFYAELRKLAGLTDDAVWGNQHDRSLWPELKIKMEDVIRTKTRDEWCVLMEHSDVCFAPVLSMAEAPHHPHNVARKTFVTRDGLTQPAPAPRFSRTVAELPDPAPIAGQHSDDVLRWAGHSAEEISALRAAGAVR
jgi:alpha-methylacyl-CoA racemase